MIIDGRQIGPCQSPYIIAEMSANHNGDIGRAFATIKMSKDMGASAVKIQTYTADTMTIPCERKEFKIEKGLWRGRYLFDLYKQAETPYEWHKPLFDYAREIGITLFSSPFDKTAVDLLEDLNTPAYKIASFEIIDIPLIKLVASTGKPIIISTGMASLDEISEAVQVSRDYGVKDLALLHCISSYPAPIEESNLLTIPDLAKRFGVISGLSDHTKGTIASVSSVPLGASIIEKHVMLDSDDEGVDSGFSIKPNELKDICVNTKIAFQSLGKPGYELKNSEQLSIKKRRSIYVVKDIKKGEPFSEKNIRNIRPGLGLSPKHYEDILGRNAKKDIARGEPLNWDLIV